VLVLVSMTKWNCLIPRLHDQANMKQMYLKYMCTTCALIAWYLL